MFAGRTVTAAWGAARRGYAAAQHAAVASRRGLSTAGAADAKDTLIVFDTTLRDGEQSPGVTLQAEQKLLIARQLSRLGVTVCEAGFPIASEGDYLSVHQIATEVGPITEGRKSGEPMVICGLARAVEGDIERCANAIRPAPRHRIHTFLATSDIHLEYKLNMTRAECLEQIDKMVRFAKSCCQDIEFSPEDAGRSDVEFLVDALGVAIEAGATTLNIPDTVGYNTPEMYGDRIKALIERTTGAADVVWSTHCHNDLGLATANTLAGITAGARQIEVTINGVGERAGNTALEEVVMAINVHPGAYNVDCQAIDTTMLTTISNTVASLTGMSVQRNKAIVGANAFSHESGIHQDGVLKHQETYEIMRPETVGLHGHDGMVLGKLSGRHAFKTRMASLGYPLEGDELKNTFKRFKQVADTKADITDGDLHAIYRDVIRADAIVEYWKLVSVNVVTGSAGQATCTATVSMDTPAGDNVVYASVSSGPVDAIYKAIDHIMDLPAGSLEDYRIDSVGGGSDALGEVSVLVSSETEGVFSGSGADGDVLRASAIAYVNAQNSLYAVTTGKAENKKANVGTSPI